MKNAEQKYYLGLDIGTESVGYAVTDSNYNILKFNGKAMWGSRLFNEAETAESRRLVRTNRRRIQRRGWRIQLLQELFAEEITKKDPGFYLRMKESALYTEDKSYDQVYSLFSDNEYSDVDFYKTFPTIYHLRKALIEGKEEYDIRLIYLALHHIIKHRGHFLFNGSVEKVTSFRTTYELLSNTLEDEFDLALQCDSIERLSEILNSKEMTIRDKSSHVMDLLHCDAHSDKTDKQLKSIVVLICGGTSKLADLFSDDELSECDRPSICFSKTAYEDIRDSLEDILQERCGVIDVIKAVYDWAILADVLNGGEYEGTSYISIAKVKAYEKHAMDLKMLKAIVRKYNVAEYSDFFQKAGNDNYVSYIGSTKINGKKVSVRRCKREDFYRAIKKLFDGKNNNEDAKSIEYIKQEIEQGTFLPLQVTKENGVIPYQVHGIELRKILENAKKYFPFISEKHSDGFSVEEKIISIFEFKIPYYVGPLNTVVGNNSWMVRKQEGAIRPWNFDELVDLDKSAEKFIRRMTNKCTYLVGKDVLPQNSLIYSEFTVLNELNNVKIAGEKLPVNLKKSIIEDVFKKNKNVTGKKFISYLKSEGYDIQIEDLSGFEQKFNSSLSSYVFFNKIFGTDMGKYSVQQMIEDIILWITLYGEDTKMLKRVIRNHYSSEELSDERLKKVCKLKFRGWGRFSGEFLQMVRGCDRDIGETFNIIQALRDTSDNLMQLLSQKYTFLDEIEVINHRNMDKVDIISYDTLVADLVASPSIKRSIWQVIQITEEIRKIMGKEPDKIFVEMARGGGKKEDRKVSRKQSLIHLYENIQGEEREWRNELEKRPESAYRSIKLYLYYTQMGRCMYSGEPIELSRLADATVYDRDHIYPQSKTKDDSIDNLVLVKSGLNREKNVDIISPEIQNKMISTWKMFLDKKLISKEKYNRLTRRTPLTDEELAGFINRQLVETRQSSKLVATVMKQMYENSQIVYVKAGRVSEFRKKPLNMIKVRSMNDLHHAKDAYLNVVVGNVYHEKFTNNPLQWLKKHPDDNYSLNQMYNFDLIKNGELVWKRGKDGTIANVIKYMNKNDIQYTRYAICNKHGQNGGMFDQQIVGKNENASVPIKEGMDVKKYGGYKTETPAYFALIESEDKKGRKQRSIEAVPLYLQQRVENNPKLLEKYFQDEIHLSHPRILLKKIKKDAYLIINGFPMHLRGTTGKSSKSQLVLQGAVQLILDRDNEKYLKHIEKYIQRSSERTDKKQLLSIGDADMITKEDNEHLYDVFQKKLIDSIYKYRPANQASTLSEGREKFLCLTVEEQCIVLNEILHLFQCKPITGNLKLIGGSSLAGSIKVNKTITNNKNIVLCNQSITGLFQQEIDLLNV